MNLFIYKFHKNTKFKFLFIIYSSNNSKINHLTFLCDSVQYSRHCKKQKHNYTSHSVNREEIIVKRKEIIIWRNFTVVNNFASKNIYKRFIYRSKINFYNNIYIYIYIKLS